MVLALDEVVIGACEVFEELHDPREITLARVYGTPPTGAGGYGSSGRREEKLRAAGDGGSRGGARQQARDGVTDATRSKNGSTPTTTTMTSRGGLQDVDANTMDVEEDEVEAAEGFNDIGKSTSKGAGVGVGRFKGSGPVSTGLTVGGEPVDPTKCLEVEKSKHPSTRLNC